MEDDILETIIAVEREILERLDAEGWQAAQMLERLRRDLEEETRQEEERLAASLRQRVAQSRKEAKERADAMLRTAARWSEQMEGLDNETLEGCIGRHLTRICSGQSG